MDEFQLEGTVKVVPDVMYPRHCPPPMSVKVTLLPVPQVVADANVGKEKMNGSASRTPKMHDAAFCKGIDILNGVKKPQVQYIKKRNCDDACNSSIAALSTPQSLLIADSPPLAPNDEPEDHEQPRTAMPSPEHPRTTPNANEHH